VNLELKLIKNILSDRRELFVDSKDHGIPFDVEAAIYTAIRTFDHDDFMGEEDHQQLAIEKLYKKFESAMSKDYSEYLVKSESSEHQIDSFWLAFELLCNPCYEDSPTIDDAAAMVLLLAEALLEETKKPNPDFVSMMGISLKIGRTEAFLATLKGASPIYVAPSYEQIDKANRRNAGAAPSWWKRPLQELIDQTEPGLSWGLLFKRLAAMGNDVMHPSIRSVEYIDGKLKLTPTSDCHNPRSITFSALTRYKKPTRR